MPKKSGFTLIELLVTISIISILTIIGFVSYQIILKNSRDVKRQSDLKQIQSALEQYRADQFYYPDSLHSPLTFGSSLTNCIGNPTPSCTVTKTYLNTLPTDPTGNPQYNYVPMPSACDNSTSSKCTSYCLYSQLENANQVDIASCADISQMKLEVRPP